MMLWAAFALLLAGAAAFAAAPFLRAAGGKQNENARSRIFAQQIADIDREERQQIISCEEANALRVEAQRRLIAARQENQTKETAMQQPQATIAIATVGIVVAGAVALYAIKGRPEIASVRASPHAVVSPADLQTATRERQVGGVDSMVANLAARLEREPDDADGWRMLGWSYFNLNRHEQAAEAYARAVALAPKNAGYQAAYGEALVMAAGGFVTDEAKEAFRQTIAFDAENPRARFFLGLAKDQAGNTKGAIDDWIDLVNAAPADADWAPDLRKRIVQRAKETGIRVDGRVKDLPAPQASIAPAPSVAQVQAAMAMPEEDRQAMVAAMVERLAARLKENPDDPDGWVRLIRSHMVLGRPADARADLDAAMKAFAGEPAVKARILSQAQALGVNTK